MGNRLHVAISLLCFKQDLTFSVVDNTTGLDAYPIETQTAGRALICGIKGRSGPGDGSAHGKLVRRIC